MTEVWLVHVGTWGKLDVCLKITDPLKRLFFKNKHRQKSSNTNGLEGQKMQPGGFGSKERIPESLGQTLRVRGNMNNSCSS